MLTVNVAALNGQIAHAVDNTGIVRSPQGNGSVFSRIPNGQITLDVEQIEPLVNVGALAVDDLAVQVQNTLAGDRDRFRILHILQQLQGGAIGPGRQCIGKGGEIHSPITTDHRCHCIGRNHAAGAKEVGIAVSLGGSDVTVGAGIAMIVTVVGVGDVVICLRRNEDIAADRAVDRCGAVTIVLYGNVFNIFIGVAVNSFVLAVGDLIDLCTLQDRIAVGADALTPDFGDKGHPIVVLVVVAVLCHTGLEQVGRLARDEVLSGEGSCAVALGHGIAVIAAAIVRSHKGICHGIAVGDLAAAVADEGCSVIVAGDIDRISDIAVLYGGVGIADETAHMVSTLEVAVGNAQVLNGVVVVGVAEQTHIAPLGHSIRAGYGEAVAVEATCVAGVARADGYPHSGTVAAGICAVPMEGITGVQVDVGHQFTGDVVVDVVYIVGKPVQLTGVVDQIHIVVIPISILTGIHRGLLVAATGSAEAVAVKDDVDIVVNGFRMDLRILLTVESTGKAPGAAAGILAVDRSHILDQLCIVAGVIHIFAAAVAVQLSIYIAGTVGVGIPLILSRVRAGVVAGIQLATHYAAELTGKRIHTGGDSVTVRSIRAADEGGFLGNAPFGSLQSCAGSRTAQFFTFPVVAHGQFAHIADYIAALTAGGGDRAAGNADGLQCIQTVGGDRLAGDLMGATIITVMPHHTAEGSDGTTGNGNGLTGKDAMDSAGTGIEIPGLDSAVAPGIEDTVGDCHILCFHEACIHRAAGLAVVTGQTDAVIGSNRAACHGQAAAGNGGSTGDVVIGGICKIVAHQGQGCRLIAGDDQRCPLGNGNSRLTVPGSIALFIGGRLDLYGSGQDIGALKCQGHSAAGDLQSRNAQRGSIHRGTVQRQGAGLGIIGGGAVPQNVGGVVIADLYTTQEDGVQLLTAPAANAIHVIVVALVNGQNHLFTVTQIPEGHTVHGLAGLRTGCLRGGYTGGMGVFKNLVTKTTAGTDGAGAVISRPIKAVMGQRASNDTGAAAQGGIRFLLQIAIAGDQNVTGDQMGRNRQYGITETVFGDLYTVHPHLKVEIGALRDTVIRVYNDAADVVLTLKGIVRSLEQQEAKPIILFVLGDTVHRHTADVASIPCFVGGVRRLVDLAAQRTGNLLGAGGISSVGASVAADLADTLQISMAGVLTTGGSAAVIDDGAAFSQKQLAVIDQAGAASQCQGPSGRHSQSDTLRDGQGLAAVKGQIAAQRIVTAQSHIRLRVHCGAAQQADGADAGAGKNLTINDITVYDGILTQAVGSGIQHAHSAAAAGNGAAVQGQIPDPAIEGTEQGGLDLHI